MPLSLAFPDLQDLHSSLPTEILSILQGLCLTSSSLDPSDWPLLEEPLSLSRGPLAHAALSESTAHISPKVLLQNYSQTTL